MKQFEVMWANLPQPIGWRPVFIAEVTSTIRSIPQEVRVGGREGLSFESVVNHDNIHVIPKALLGERIGAIAVARHREVKRSLGYALDWPELKTL